MSIIEKALDKLAKAEVRPTPATGSSSGVLLREVPVEGLVHADWDATAPLSTAPASKVVKTSNTVALDLKALAKKGFLTPETMHLPRAEEYRRIKRPILMHAFGESQKKPKNSNLALVTSSVAGEGKSYTCLNLAMSVAAELDRTVLLVDADVFQQGLTKTLGLASYPGLTDFLRTEGADLADYLLRTNVPNLAFLPAGRLDHQVAELWASAKTQQFMDELARRYSDRLVIFDTPPILAHASTLVLEGMVGQVLLVVEAEKTAQHVVGEALHAIGEKVRVGLVLNKSNQRENADYGYGNYSQ